MLTAHSIVMAKSQRSIGVATRPEVPEMIGIAIVSATAVAMRGHHQLAAQGSAFGIADT
jgi:hypothetical protein